MLPLFRSVRFGTEPGIGLRTPTAYCPFTSLRMNNLGPWVCFVLISCSSLPGISQPSTGFQFGKPDLKLLEESDQIDQAYARKGLIVTDPEITAYVESVGKKVLANQPPLENVIFKFRVIRDPIVNAYALPNGSIYVTSGLIARLQNEAQLAGVLSHEITHVTHRHGYLRNRDMRKKMVAIDIFQAVSAAGGAMAQGAANAIISSRSG